MYFLTQLFNILCNTLFILYISSDIDDNLNHSETIKGTVVILNSTKGMGRCAV